MHKAKNHVRNRNRQIKSPNAQLHNELQNDHLPFNPRCDAKFTPNPRTTDKQTNKQASTQQTNALVVVLFRTPLEGDVSHPLPAHAFGILHGMPECLEDLVVWQMHNFQRIDPDQC